jgi:N-methylhydantoinase B
LEELGGKSRLLSYGECEIDKGTVVYRRAASGGGYGDPLERDPGLVIKDLQEGLISPAAARDVYGVAVDSLGNLDLEGSGRRRAELARQRTNKSA